MKHFVFPPAAHSSGEDFGDGVDSGMVVDMLNHFYLHMGDIPREKQELRNKIRGAEKCQKIMALLYKIVLLSKFYKSNNFN
jgi:hypothetical protein